MTILKYLGSPNEADRAAIPGYGLYGESLAWKGPEPVHCEAISVRAPIHDWTIRPHRHTNLYQVLLLEQGHAELSLDGVERTLTWPAVACVAAGAVHGYRFEPAADGHVVSLPTFALREFLRPDESLRGLLDRSFILEAPASLDHVKAIAQAVRILAAEFRERDVGRWLAVTSAAGLLLAQILSAAAESEPVATAESRGLQRVQRFQALVNQHYLSQLSVIDYARTLGVSHQQLAVDCRRHTGCSPLQLIHERKLMEAKRLLVYTILTVGEVSHRLNFSDPAYFSRFFEKRVGCCPSEFRAQARTKF